MSNQEKQSEKVEDRHDKKTAKAEAASKEADEGMPGLVKDRQQLIEHLKAGGRSGISNKFGKPAFFDSAGEKPGENPKPGKDEKTDGSSADPKHGKEEIQDVPAEQLAAKDPATLADINPEKLAVLDPAALAAVNPEKLAALDPAALAAVNPEKLAVLDPAALAAVNPEKLAALNPAALAAVNPEKLVALKPDALAAISPEQLDKMESGQSTDRSTGKEQPDEAEVPQKMYTSTLGAEQMTPGSGLDAEIYSIPSQPNSASDINQPRSQLDPGDYETVAHKIEAEQAIQRSQEALSSGSTSYDPHLSDLSEAHSNVSGVLDGDPFLEERVKSAFDEVNAKVGKGYDPNPDHEVLKSGDNYQFSRTRYATAYENEVNLQEQEKKRDLAEHRVEPAPREVNQPETWYVKNPKQLLEYLKAGGRSGISFQFGKPVLFDSAADKANLGEKQGAQGYRSVADHLESSSSQVDAAESHVARNAVNQEEGKHQVSEPSQVDGVNQVPQAQQDPLQVQQAPLQAQQVPPQFQQIPPQSERIDAANVVNASNIIEKGIVQEE